MAERVLNFGAGPAALPVEVLREAQRDLLAVPGLGMSALEVSHRSAWFAGVLEEAEEHLRVLLGIPATHRVVFCQGGASQQFAMVAMNLAGAPTADYIVTGAWGAKAAHEAGRLRDVRVAWTGEAEGFVRTPTDAELEEVLASEAAYVHLTSNETIQGVAYARDPQLATAGTLVADMSSDLLSRPVDGARYGVIYAGAQKNLGPAGVTVVVVRDDLAAGAPGGLPSMLDYRTYTEHDSLYNTPPVFAIYVLMLVGRWLRTTASDLATQHATNRAKAGLLYDAIDGSEGFHRGHAAPQSRSLMNVTWRLPTEDLERAFLAEAAAEGMVELRGHRSVGGIRASLYNAMPLAGAEALASFMRAFAAAHG